MTRLAARFLGASVALVSLVEGGRQYFRSCFGLPEPWASRREIPFSHSFCQHVVTSGQPVVIGDARLDSRVTDNPAVAEFNVIAYLGVPLTIDGHVIGAFSAIDGRPRVWTTDDVEVLKDLAESVIAEIRLRQERDEVARQCVEAEEARRRLEVMLSSIGDGVIATDADGLITFINGVAEELTGWTRVDAVGRPLADVFLAIDEVSRQVVERRTLLASREDRSGCLSGHLILIARDGKEHPIEDSAAPMRGEGTPARGNVLVFRDISEHRQQEQKLADRERQFRTLAESIPQLTWIANPDGHIFWYNRRWYDYTGTTFEQMEGWKWQSVHDPRELPGVLERWNASIATGEPFDMVFPLKGADGVFHPFLTRVMPVKNASAQVERWFGTNTDITESQRREDELRDARSQLQVALKAGRMGTWTFDVVTRELTCSDTCKQIYGRSPHDPFTYDDLVATVLDADRPGWQRAVREAVEQRQELNVEYRIRWPDGSIHWVSVRAGSVVRGMARPISMSGVAFIIDAEKEAAFERERLVARLQDQDKQKNDFLAMLGHEAEKPPGRHQQCRDAHIGEQCERTPRPVGAGHPAANESLVAAD